MHIGNLKSGLDKYCKHPNLDDFIGLAEMLRCVQQSATDEEIREFVWFALLRRVRTEALYALLRYVGLVEPDLSRLMEPSCQISSRSENAREKVFETDPSVIDSRSNLTYEIVMAADAHYRLPTRVAVGSLGRHVTGCSRICVLTPDDYSAKLIRNDLYFSDIPIEVLTRDSLKASNLSHVSDAASLRLRCLEHSDEPMVVFLDSDLVVKADLIDLVALFEESGESFGARTMTNDQAEVIRQIYDEPGRRRNLDGQKDFEYASLCNQRSLSSGHFFNAGVLLFRNEPSAQGMLSDAQKALHDFQLHDQEALNLVSGSYFDIGTYWNYQPSRDAELTSKGIIHWVGRLKPWLCPTVPESSWWIVEALSSGGVRLFDTE